MINGFDNSTFVLTIRVLESMLCAEVHLFLRINHRKALHTNILFGLCNKKVREPLIRVSQLEYLFVAELSLWSLDNTGFCAETSSWNFHNSVRSGFLHFGLSSFSSTNFRVPSLKISSNYVSSGLQVQGRLVHPPISD